MKMFLIENSELILTILKIILALIVPFITLMINLIKNKNDPESIIKKSIIEKEKKIIDDYFDNLNYQELNNIKNNDYKIDSKIYDLIREHFNNRLTQKFFKEISRVDRYKTVENIISKINIDTSFKKTFAWFIITISNYFFYFSKSLINLLFYTLFVMLIGVPIFYIFSILYTLYSFMGKYIFGISIFALSIFLVINGENKKERRK